MFFKLLMLVLIVFAIGLGFFVSKKGILKNITPAMGIAFILLWVMGYFIMEYASGTFQSYSERRSWPQVQGEVVSSRIAGDRAVKPEIVFRYQVNGEFYEITSDLEMPAFGSRGNRKDAALKISGQYSVGKRVNVTYNPDNPQQSFLVTRVPVTAFLQITVGAMFYFFGSSLTTLFFLRRRTA